MLGVARAAAVYLVAVDVQQPRAASTMCVTVPSCMIGGLHVGVLGAGSRCSRRSSDAKIAREAIPLRMLLAICVLNVCRVRMGRCSYSERAVGGMKRGGEILTSRVTQRGVDNVIARWRCCSEG